MEKTKEILTTVESFAKANPEMVARLRAAAIETLKPLRAEMTATELEAAQVAFCLGGVWVIINQVNIAKPL